MRCGTNWKGEYINHAFILQRAKRGELRIKIYMGDITENGR
jgi:hypothetical protein